MRTATTPDPLAGATASAAEPTGRRRVRRFAVPVVAAAVVALLLAAAVRLVAPGSPFGVEPGATSRWLPAPTAALIVVALGLIAASGLLAARRRSRPQLRRAAWVVFFTLVLGGQLLLAHAVLQNPPYDAAQVFTAAYTNAVAPTPRLFSAAMQADYFAMYPNNVLLVGFFTGLFALLHLLGLQGAGGYLFAATVVDCVALTASFAGACWIAGRVAGRRAAVVVALLGLPLLGVSPWIDVPYSDVLAMPFPVAAIAISLAWPAHGSTRSRVLLWATLGALAAVGFAIKPTTVFAVGAVLLIDLLRMRDARSVVSAAAAVAAAAVAFGAVHAGVALAPQPATSAIGSVPFAHYLAMGASADGSFHQQDLDATMALPAADRSSARFVVWEQRAAAMGPVGYPVFLASKVLTAVSDGSFFQGHEGVGPYSTAFRSGDAISARVQSVYPLSAPLHPLIATLWQAAWWTTLLLCLVPGRRGLGASARAMRPVLRIGLLLLLAFLCLSESRSRYLYHYLPVALILAGIGATLVAQHAAALTARLRR